MYILLYSWRGSFSKKKGGKERREGRIKKERNEVSKGRKKKKVGE